ncbi:MAG: hypothetical protein MPJ25_04650 [Pirellulales bacterium]|nr:hypothetical protein [Pirellulales bacterium]
MGPAASLDLLARKTDTTPRVPEPSVAGYEAIYTGVPLDMLSPQQRQDTFTALQDYKTWEQTVQQTYDELGLRGAKTPEQKYAAIEKAYTEQQQQYTRDHVLATGGFLPGQLGPPRAPALFSVAPQTTQVVRTGPTTPAEYRANKSNIYDGWWQYTENTSPPPSVADLVSKFATPGTPAPPSKAAPGTLDWALDKLKYWDSRGRPGPISLDVGGLQVSSTPGGLFEIKKAWAYDVGNRRVEPVSDAAFNRLGDLMDDLGRRVENQEYNQYVKGAVERYDRAQENPFGGLLYAGIVDELSPTGIVAHPLSTKDWGDDAAYLYTKGVGLVTNPLAGITGQPVSTTQSGIIFDAGIQAAQGDTEAARNLPRALQQHWQAWPAAAAVELPGEFLSLIYGGRVVTGAAGIVVPSIWGRKIIGADGTVISRVRSIMNPPAEGSTGLVARFERALSRPLGISEGRWPSYRPGTWGLALDNIPYDRIPKTSIDQPTGAWAYVIAKAPQQVRDRLVKSGWDEKSADLYVTEFQRAQASKALDDILPYPKGVPDEGSLRGNIHGKEAYQFLKRVHERAQKEGIDVQEAGTLATMVRLSLKGKLPDEFVVMTGDSDSNIFTKAAGAKFEKIVREEAEVFRQQTGETLNIGRYGKTTSPKSELPSPDDADHVIDSHLTEKDPRKAGYRASFYDRFDPRKWGVRDYPYEGATEITGRRIDVPGMRLRSPVEVKAGKKHSKWNPEKFYRAWKDTLGDVATDMEYVKAARELGRQIGDDELLRKADLLDQRIKTTIKVVEDITGEKFPDTTNPEFYKYLPESVPKPVRHGLIPVPGTASAQAWAKGVSTEAVAEANLFTVPRGVTAGVGRTAGAGANIIGGPPVNPVAAPPGPGPVNRGRGALPAGFAPGGQFGRGGVRVGGPGQTGGPGGGLGALGGLGGIGGARGGGLGALGGLGTRGAIPAGGRDALGAGARGGGAGGTGGAGGRVDDGLGSIGQSRGQVGFGRAGAGSDEIGGPGSKAGSQGSLLDDTGSSPSSGSRIPKAPSYRNPAFPESGYTPSSVVRTPPSGPRGSPPARGAIDPSPIRAPSSPGPVPKPYGYKPPSGPSGYKITGVKPPGSTITAAPGYPARGPPASYPIKGPAPPYVPKAPPPATPPRTPPASPPPVFPSLLRGKSPPILVPADIPIDEGRKIHPGRQVENKDFRASTYSHTFIGYARNKPEISYDEKEVRTKIELPGDEKTKKRSTGKKTDMLFGSTYTKSRRDPLLGNVRAEGSVGSGRPDGLGRLGSPSGVLGSGLGRLAGGGASGSGRSSGSGGSGGPPKLGWSGGAGDMNISTKKSKSGGSGGPPKLGWSGGAGDMIISTKKSKSSKSGKSGSKRSKKSAKSGSWF